VVLIAMIHPTLNADGSQADELLQIRSQLTSSSPSTTRARCQGVPQSIGRNQQNAVFSGRLSEAGHMRENIETEWPGRSMADSTPDGIRACLDAGDAADSICIATQIRQLNVSYSIFNAPLPLDAAPPD
jgi:hypothetical protein